MHPDAAADTALHYSLLDEPLIRWRCLARGETHHSSLPELFAAIAANRLRDFPALRPHQRHPWHAFLTQLAAIAMHRQDQAEPWTSAADWRAALLALTPDDADGAAWCLVSPPDRPALLQAPVPGGYIDNWDSEANTPDRLDMLITSRNHDLKQARVQRASPEDWLFALLSLQTQEGSNSGSYKGISRMNSGAGSRPGVGVALRDAIGTRWRSDVATLMRSRDKIVDVYGFEGEGGVALTWLVPWDGVTAISFARLDPHYVEICRQVRLQLNDRIVARTFKTPQSRIEDSADRKGRTGDPWTPVNKSKAKILSVPSKGFDYKLMAELLLGSEYEPALAQDLSVWPEGADLDLIARGIARGNSETSGYHERRIAVTPRMRRLILGPQRVTIEQITKRHIDDIAALRELLRAALIVLFANGEGKVRNASISKRASRFARPFEQHEDARFFLDLGNEVEADEAQRADRRMHWLLGLVERAEGVLREAFDAGPRNGMQRYKARAAAVSHFKRGLWGPKPALPELADHYRQQAAAVDTKGGT